MRRKRACEGDKLANRFYIAPTTSESFATHPLLDIKQLRHHESIHGGEDYCMMLAICGCSIGNPGCVRARDALVVRKHTLEVGTSEGRGFWCLTSN